jgi:hypothetical protein
MLLRFEVAFGLVEVEFCISPGFLADCVSSTRRLGLVIVSTLTGKHVHIVKFLYWVQLAEW